MSNKRNNNSGYERKRAFRDEKPTILIVCEGENTEPSYFKKFKLVTAKLVPVGAGCETIRVVEKAKDISDEREFDQIWCVFDADPKPDNPHQENNFNEAIRIAKKYGFEVAYSNQAFEYWILLHFDDHQGGSMDRCDYKNKINSLIRSFGIQYNVDDRKLITKELFDLMNGNDERTGKVRRDLAINRAKRNYNKFPHRNSYRKESSTTVFKLVEEILKFI